MAPALTVTPQYNHYDAVEETEKLSHRRRALASVDNVSIPMEEDDMGLQNQPSLAKDSQEMEQILVDLGNNDLVQADLLQAIKTLESGGDSLSTGDPDGMFPLSGFDLADTVDSESDATEDKIRLIQARLERRCAFLLRRLRILQARAIGKRISEEASQTFEKCAKGARRDGGGRPMGLKALLKRIETTAALQASAASRSVVGPKYYRAGTSKGDASRSASIGIPSGTLTGLEDSAGALRSHLSVVKHQLDSDATASSSGAESNDEAVTYNNTHQQPMPIEKRALYSWQKARASIAARWCWLQVQVQELEYKIRQHTELHAQVREAKGPVEFEVSGESQFEDTCSRVRPLRRDTFNKRKLLQMHNLHIATNKAAKPSDINCRCVGSSCAVCTGRFEATQPAAPSGMLPPAARRALVDPSHHPVLSDVNDLRPSVHLSALTSRSWFRSRVTKSWRGAHTGTAPRAPPAPPPRHRRLTTKLKRGRPPLSRKIRERERDEDSASGQERGRGRSSTENRLWRRQSYDIDNIVIPQSVAASTRPEILTYKEIITPKWRVMEIPETPLNNGVSKSNRMSIESDDEDISEAAVQARHTRAETRERNRYLRKRRSRRRNTEEENNDPIPEVVVRQPTPPLQETVPPYSPRQFPLKDDLYQDMLSKMPEGYRPISPELDPDITMEEDTSSLSPLSPLNFDGDDPDDAEWNPSNEKSDKRRSTLR
ncbi:KAT8 regulatory NSL complex subunit 1 [Danaus plexippus]|uniref:KAT8 regulatory NSL complex subunit 1 n=1 Tax=Danaus plexippus TaxID=13037 RepID=UPI002AAFB823|nr:KAT8 regulatory NSL complex subunit 1 [Danaus plexippus]XP_061378422.1 KAT8 regulatory NSL complex subunit 1 [Danaus plexippus]XP_061378424.1 KAT8 regulatory NSL complex subunit 1 [Danaus plexippus]XP_061378425.1 KAT8 regulatory NSL complex subunit 1 [Danaus plexippus]